MWTNGKESRAASSSTPESPGPTNEDIAPEREGSQETNCDNFGHENKTTQIVQHYPLFDGDTKLPCNALAWPRKICLNFTSIRQRVRRR